jgi:hypothetical protein
MTCMWRIVIGALIVCAWLTSPAAQARLQIGLNFTSTTKAESHATTEAPDANGAVGPSHIVELINGDFKVYDKRTGTLLLTQTSAAFWEKALGQAVFAANPHHADPRLVFDIHARRWYASAQRPRPPVDGDMSVIVARSESADPTAGWKGLSFYTDPERTPKTGADFDRLGYNRDGIYISINQFDVMPDGKFAAHGSGLFSIKKRDFNRATPLLTLDRRDHLTDARENTPVVDLDGKSEVGTFWAMIQGRATRMAPHDLFIRSDISGDLAAWKLNRVATTVGDGPGQSLRKTGFPPMSVSQPGGHPAFTWGTRPAATVQLVNGAFWLVHAVVHPDDGKRSALRWWHIRATDNAVLGEGILADPALSVFDASIAADAAGHVVIGCSGTGATQHLSAYAIAGRVSGDTVAFDPAFTLLKAGAGERKVDGRWGDYTTTGADPTAPGTFWTFQVIAQANGDWATQVTQVRVVDGK